MLSINHITKIFISIGIISLTACSPRLTKSQNILYVPGKDSTVSVYDKISEITPNQSVTSATKTLVDKYIKHDGPIEVQGLCVSFHATNSSSGATACGLHCDNGNTYGMACDAEIFEHWGFDKIIVE